MNTDKTSIKNESQASCLDAFINSISDNGLIELYRLAYNDGFDNIADKKDIIKHRQKQIDKVKKKYCL